VVGLAEFLGDGYAHERADDDGGRGSHGRVSDFVEGRCGLDGIGSDTM
jgi:hypothetical protein